MTATQYLQGIGAIADRYDRFIFDVWGTLHNGERTFPGVLPTLHLLRDMGKEVAFLSNSPSRVENLTHRLETSHGIGPNLYQAAFNSGESTYCALRDRADPWHARLGQQFYFICADNHTENFVDLPYEQVHDIETADFIIVTRTLNYDETLQDYDARLNAAAARGIPMVCANPDKIVGIGDTIFTCPGSMAAYYETMGGEVFYHGKPHRAIYDQLAAQFKTTISSARTLAIGDALETDILGGCRMGYDTLLLTDGIHARDINPHAMLDDVHHLASEFGVAPTFAMDQLRP